MHIRYEKLTESWLFCKFTIPNAKTHFAIEGALCTCSFSVLLQCDQEQKSIHGDLRYTKFYSHTLRSCCAEDSVSFFTL